MKMVEPYTIVIIKPLTIGRGHGPNLLRDLLDSCPIVLRKFRQWDICSTTLQVLSTLSDDYKTDVQMAESIPARPSWICLFRHTDGVTDPTDLLLSVCGPSDRSKWVEGEIRHHYQSTQSPLDTVLHISKPDKASLEAELLFLNFNEASL